MHVFPQLRKLEEKYPDELVVIGVHSAKFQAEKSTANVRQAVLRYDIRHPVVNDGDFKVWNKYHARAWPTLVFIDPEGRIVGKHEGEIPVEAADNLLAELIDQFDDRGLIDRRPLSFKLEREKEWERPLSYPGKVLASAATDRLFIADSNHHRLLICSMDGEVVDVVGGGQRGFVDGGYDEARFDDPQGMDLDGHVLYVADTGNHAIRAVDLANRNVKTLAGTGQQSHGFHNGGQGRSIDQNSPWDVAVSGSWLYIAMAGFHQLWRLDLASGAVQPHAGSGREWIADGPLLEAMLAQPSGIVAGGTSLFFTDSETSAIREADLSADGGVRTLVGVGLFDSGDIDGVGPAVRLQHPLGIDLSGDMLYVTDTYNNKIKRVVPSTRSAETVLGSGEPAHRDGVGAETAFHEPGGLSLAGGTLYVADTNNHAIRVADLVTGEVTTLPITGV